MSVASRVDRLRTLVAGEGPWDVLARAGLCGMSLGSDVGGLALTLEEEAILHEESGAALVHGPLWSTSRIAPFLPEADRRLVAGGAATWVLAEAPLVPDLDTASAVAVIGGDTVWELAGAQRELLASIDETRPLGVVLGGDVVRPLFPSAQVVAVRTRSLVLLAAEALGVARRAGELHAAPAERAGPTGAVRSLVLDAARAVGEGAAGAERLVEAARAAAVRNALAATEAAVLGAEAGTWESLPQRLRRRALWLGDWDAPGERLLSGDRRHRGGRDAGPDDGLPAQRPGDPPTRGAALR